jgi:arylsulfatase A-like enzyme
MALNIDIAPTILQLAGIEVPPRMQGRSLASFLQRAPADWRDEFFYEHQFIRATWGHQPYIPGVEGVVLEDIKYMKYLHGGDTVVYEELYKRDGQPELDNLADDPEYTSLKETLNEKISTYKYKLQ